MPICNKFRFYFLAREKTRTAIEDFRFIQYGKNEFLLRQCTRKHFFLRICQSRGKGAKSKWSFIARSIASKSDLQFPRWTSTSDFRKTILLRYLLLRHWVRTAPGNGLIFCNDINCTAIKIELCLQWQPCNHDVLNQTAGLSLRDRDSLTDERCTVVPSYPNNTNWLNNCCVGGI